MKFLKAAQDLHFGKWASCASGGCLMLLVAGCALPAKEARLDGQALMPDDLVAKIALHPAESFTGRPLNTKWAIDIITIDGKPVPRSTILLQISPGEHTITYACQVKFSVNDLGGAQGKGQFKYKFEAGKTYFAYAKGSAWKTKESRGGFIETSGDCSFDYFSYENPFYRL